MATHRPPKDPGTPLGSGKDATAELRALLRRGLSKPDSEQPGKVKAAPGASHSPGPVKDELRTALDSSRQATAGSQDRTPAGGDAHNPNPVDAIRALRGDGSAATTGAARSRSDSGRGVADIKRLAAGDHAPALRGEPVSENRASSTVRSNLGASIRDAVTDRSEDATYDEVAKDRTAFGNARKLAWAAGLAIILVAAGITVYRAVTTKSAPVLATQVAQVGRELVSYVHDTGRLPESLTTLSAFPKDALELPADAYVVRFLEPRLEFFLFRVTTGRAVVVGRRGDEAWAFDPGSRNELFRVPAR